MAPDSPLQSFEKSQACGVSLEAGSILIAVLNHSPPWPMFPCCFFGDVSPDDSADVKFPARCETSALCDNDVGAVPTTDSFFPGAVRVENAEHSVEGAKDPTASLTTVGSNFEAVTDTELQVKCFGSTASVSSLHCSSPGTVGAESDDETLRLCFLPPGCDHEVEVSFHSAPLCLRFSETWPPTVIAVGTGFRGSCPVRPSWVLTHVNDQRVFPDYQRASRQLRVAAKTLPRRSSTSTVGSAASGAM